MKKVSEFAFYFVDEDGTENVSNVRPSRHSSEPFWVCEIKVGGKTYDMLTELPRGTIKELFNIDLTWEDEPIVIKVT